MTDTQSRTFTNPDEASRVLGAWFVGRMMVKGGAFELRLVDGVQVLVDSIMSITVAANGSIWLDVELTPRRTYEPKVISGRHQRTRATINAAHVTAAMLLPVAEGQEIL